MESYKRFLIEEVEMSAANAELFLNGFKTVHYKKGKYLDNLGDKCNTIRAIINGCARGFCVLDGKEITTNFYFENNFAYDYVNFIKNQPSKMIIQALDSIEVIEMKMGFQEFLAIENLAFYKMHVLMFKLNFLKVEEERQNFIIKSPKERYLDLLENNKQVISRVPQHQVASYIGITPEHLSRIRKEIL